MSRRGRGGRHDVAVGYGTAVTNEQVEALLVAKPAAPRTLARAERGRAAGGGQRAFGMVVRQRGRAAIGLAAASAQPGVEVLVDETQRQPH